MTLQAFCLTALGVAGILLVCSGIIDWLNQRRVSDGKRLRELYAENARLRAQLRHRNFDQEWEMDNVKTQLAIKELLLRQKWQEAARK